MHIRQRLGLTVLLSTCMISACTFDAPPPPRTPGSLPPPSVSLSAIATPVSIRQEPVRATLESLLKAAPLAAGQTEEMDARALVNEKSIVQEPRQIVEKPYRAAYCEIRKVEKQIKRRIKVGRQAFDCLVKPWEWGTCWKDVYKDVVETIVEDVKMCFPEQLEVVKTVMTPVVKLKEAVLPTKIRLRYKVELEHLDLSMSGNRLRLRPRTRVTVQADLRQGVLNSSVLIRGALQCVSVLEPDANADVRLRQAGEDIRLQTEVVSTSVDVRQLCLPGAVEGIDLALLTHPIEKLVADQLTKKLNEKLATMVQEQADQAGSQLGLGDMLRKLAEPVRQPVELSQDVWLQPHVEGLAVSQLTGADARGEATFAMTAAVEARPQVSYGPRPAPEVSSRLPVRVGASGDAFHLEPVGIVKLSVARAQLKAAIAEFIERQGGKYRDVEYDVDLYQSGANIVVEVKTRKPGLFGWKATVYLVGTPSFGLADNTIALRDLKFDLASRNVILKVAAWLFDAKVEEFLQERAVFRAEKPLADALASLAHFRSESPSGVLSGTVDRLALGQVWMANDALNFSVIAEGTSRYDARLPN